MARILIVDDESVVVDTYRLALEGEGHIVLSAANGKEAWNLWQQNTADLVVTDFQMPLMDGCELIKKIKERRSDFPVIMQTGTPPVDGENKADILLIKPVSPALLVTQVKILLAK